MEKLPIDVLPNIFTRLLAKQLAQMRCVCKPWNALLSQSSFVKSHLQHSIQNNNNDDDGDVLLFFKDRFSFHCKPFIARPSRSPHLELTNIIKLPVNLQSNKVCSSVVGSINGLICFNNGEKYDPVYYIWNPSLSAVLTLPPSLVPTHDYNVLGILLRFGYDPKTDDYKLVKVNGSGSLADMILPSFFNDDPKTVDYKVEIYSMRKGSWELIPQRSLERISMCTHGFEVCGDGLDGHVHWFGDNSVVGSKVSIVSFDLGAEKFREIRSPDSILNDNVCGLNVLGVLAEKLCLMSSVLEGECYGACEVWVMDEYGVAESWVKHHVFSKLSRIVPFGFTLHNKFLFRADKVDDEADDFEVVNSHPFGLYDPVAAKAKFFKLHPGICKIVEYVDSLVWVAPDEHM